MNETMGQVIRRLRKERNLTQEELAEQLNITSQAVSRWENETGMPDISQIVPLSNVFDVTTDVLFGKDGADSKKEVEAFIEEAEKKVCNYPEDVDPFEYNKKCCEDVQKMLEVYPNNYELLTYSLGHICCLLNDYRDNEEAKDRTEEMQKWESECIRQANVVLNHCTDIRYLTSANKWMTVLYNQMGNHVKALEYAEKLPVLDPYEEGGDWLAQIYWDLGRNEDSRRQSAENVSAALDYLRQQLFTLGWSWVRDGKFEEAYACYRLNLDIYDLIVGDREDELPFDFTLNYTQNGCAYVCMKLNRPEEAMDWLEKMVRDQRLMAKNYNVITKSNLPYFYGREIHYTADSYSREERLTPFLANEAYDPIRETDRFKAILADAEAFERGE